MLKSFSKIITIQKKIEQEYLQLKQKLLLNDENGLSNDLLPFINALEDNCQHLNNAINKFKEDWINVEEAGFALKNFDMLAHTLFPNTKNLLISSCQTEIKRLLLVIKQMRAKNEIDEEAFMLTKFTIKLCERLQLAIDNYAKEYPDEIKLIEETKQSSYNLFTLVYLGAGIQHELRDEKPLANKYFAMAWQTFQYSTSLLAEADKALLLFSLLNHDDEELVYQVKRAIKKLRCAECFPVQLLFYQQQGVQYLRKQKFFAANQAYEKALYIAEQYANIIDVGYIQLAKGHVLVTEFRMHVQESSVNKRALEIHEQLLQKSLLYFIKGLNDLKIQPTTGLTSSKENSWAISTYQDLDTICMQYTEWVKQIKILSARKTYLEKALEAREIFNEFFELLTHMGCHQLKVSVKEGQTTLNQLFQVKALLEKNTVNINKLNALLTVIDTQAEQRADMVLKKQEYQEQIEKERQDFYEKCKSELEKELELEQLQIEQKYEERRKKKQQIFMELVKTDKKEEDVLNKVKEIKQEKSKHKEISVKSFSVPDLYEKNYQAGCFYLQQKNINEASKYYQLAYIQASEKEPLKKAKALCSLAECSNYKAHVLLTKKYLQEALLLFHEATQKAVEALLLIDSLIDKKKSKHKTLKSAQELKNICYAIEIVIYFYQHMLSVNIATQLDHFILVLDMITKILFYLEKELINGLK